MDVISQGVTQKNTENSIAAEDKPHKMAATRATREERSPAWHTMNRPPTRSSMDVMVQNSSTCAQSEAGPVTTPFYIVRWVEPVVGILALLLTWFARLPP